MSVQVVRPLAEDRADHRLSRAPARAASEVRHYDPPHAARGSDDPGGARPWWERGLGEHATAGGSGSEPAFRSSISISTTGKPGLSDNAFRRLASAADRASRRGCGLAMGLRNVQADGCLERLDPAFLRLVVAQSDWQLTDRAWTPHSHNTEATCPSWS